MFIDRGGAARSLEVKAISDCLKTLRSPEEKAPWVKGQQLNNNSPRRGAFSSFEMNLRCFSSNHVRIDPLLAREYS